MTNLTLERLAQVRDNLAIYFYETALKMGTPQEEALKMALHNSRDKCRTPMQWSAQPNAGFSPEGVQTWLPVNPDYREGINVADQENDPQSMLNFYRTLLALRKTTPALIDGDYQALDEEAQDFLAFLRKSVSSEQTCLVVLNMSEQAQTPQFELGEVQARCLYSSDRARGRMDPLSSIRVPAFGIYIGEIIAMG